MDAPDYGELERKLGHAFQQRELLRCALTHRSFANENRMEGEDNEKLEFLGDAVLDLIVGPICIYLLRKQRKAAVRA